MVKLSYLSIFLNKRLSQNNNGQKNDLPTPSRIPPIRVMSWTNLVCSGPKQRKKKITNTKQARTPRKAKVKKNCVHIINPETNKKFIKSK